MSIQATLTGANLRPSSAVAPGIGIEYVKAELLRPSDNPRRMSESELADLEHSITEFGLVDPVIARRADRAVIGGHQRLFVARRLGLEQVPVIYLDISEEKAKLLNLALNKIQGEFDERKLAEILRELEALPELDLTAAGFHDDELRRLFASLEWTEFRDTAETFDVKAAVEQARAASRVSQVETWGLGRHRLMCGDATTNDVARLVGADGVDMVLTDPPYNVAYQAETSPSGRVNKGRASHAPLGPIEGDDMTPAQYDTFLGASFANLVAALPRGGPLYVCGGTGTFSAYERAFAATGVALQNGGRAQQAPTPLPSTTRRN